MYTPQSTRNHTSALGLWESYLLDGCDSDDEEEWEPARHWTCGCVDDQLWGQDSHAVTWETLASGRGQRAGLATQPFPMRFHLLKHVAGSLLALQPGQEGQHPVPVTTVLREAPWWRGGLRTAVSMWRGHKSDSRDIDSFSPCRRCHTWVILTEFTLGRFSCHLELYLE